MTKQILKIDSVKIDEKLYPRMHVDWITSSRYYNALKSGAKFPPIIVAKRGILGSKYVLVDGAHRLKANKDMKNTHIDCEVLTGLSDKEIYEKAVELNSQHGRQFSTQETTQIVVTLKNFGLDKARISALVGIPMDELEPFVAKRLTNIVGSNERVPLKSPLKHLAGGELSQNPQEQSVFNAISQIQILDEVIVLLQKDWLDTNSEQVMLRVKALAELLKPYAVEEEVVVETAKK